MAHTNGALSDSEREEFKRFKQEASEIHTGIKELLRVSNQNSEYLRHLEVLPSLKEATTLMAVEVRGMRSDLLPSATGIDRMPTKTAEFAMRTQFVLILVLLAVIGFLLTGEKFGWINDLHK